MKEGFIKKEAAGEPLLSKEFPNVLREAGHEKHAEAYEKVTELAEIIKSSGGRALLVGGFVRDFALGRISKDFDLEISGLEAKKVEEIVNQFGAVSEVGKAFGILKIHVAPGIDLDVSLPRTDSKTAEGGHKGFKTKSDPFMSIEDAARRRDFTINAMAADPLTGEVFDPFGGREDLKNRVLRVTDPERFKDDPLRALRAIQFVARMGLSIHPETEKEIQKMIPELKKLPKERIFEEWKKMLLKSEKPSLGLAAGMALNIWKELHPEFPPLKETPQEYEWHPEGDVWIHTMMAVDEAAYIAKRENLDDDKVLTVMLATLCHDLGKPSTTEFEEGRIRSRAHEEAGVEPTEKFLSSLGADKLTTEKVIKLVTDHLKPSMFYIEEAVKGKKVRDGALRKLAKRIHPASMYELVLVAEADHLGRGPFLDPKDPGQFLLPLGEYPAGKWFRKKVQALDIEKIPAPDLVMGRDLIALGYKPGKLFGEIIKSANSLRDEKEFTREQVLSMLYGVEESLATKTLEKEL